MIMTIIKKINLFYEEGIFMENKGFDKKLAIVLATVVGTNMLTPAVSAMEAETTCSAPTAEEIKKIKEIKEKEIRN